MRSGLSLVFIEPSPEKMGIPHTRLDAHHDLREATLEEALPAARPRPPPAGRLM
jgi:hypothetical protein